MRIRYGKPIKAKSLLGKQNIFSTISSIEGGYYYGAKIDGSFLGGWNGILRQSTNSKWISFAANHKYLCYVGLSATNVYKNVYNGVGFLTSDSILRGDPDDNKYGLGYSVTCITPASNISAIPAIQNYNNYWTVGDIVKEMAVLDLTDIYGAGNEPTATQFYDKYSQYFPLIATGEEITIDDKAGQITLKKLLPDEYQEVEYIEGTGTQYMGEWALNKTYTGNLTVGYKFTATEHTDAMYFSTITASNLSAGQAYSFGYVGASSDLHIRWNQVQNSVSIVDYAIPEICETSRTNAINNVTLANVSLFCHSASYRPWKGRIYKYWLKIDDEYIFDFIPCYRKSDNEIGLYDRVKKAFYANRGTGTFLKGPNVNNTISCKIAGGSSDVYYGYNNLCMPLVRDYFYNEYNKGPIDARTYDESSNSTTYTAGGGNKNFRLLSTDKNILSVVEGHHYYVRAKMSWNCQNAVITKMTNLFVLTSPGFNIVDYGKPVTNNAYFENIHISKRTGSASWVWSPIIDSGEVQDGDTFTTSDFEIIDLTNWFGPGKEPRTVQEFKEKFAKEYYGFCSKPIKLTRYQIEALPNYGYNQYCQYGDFSSSSGWSANNTSDTISINNGECTLMPGGATYPGVIRTFNGYKLNHKMIYILDVYASSNNVGKSLCINNGTGLNASIGSLKLGWNTYYKITTLNADKTSAWTVFFTYQPALEEIKFRNIMAIDLTDWYGEGNEPTTIEEFKATFPNKYYPYSKKTLLNKYMINGLGSN